MKMAELERIRVDLIKQMYNAAWEVDSSTFEHAFSLFLTTVTDEEVKQQLEKEYNEVSLKAEKIVNSINAGDDDELIKAVKITNVRKTELVEKLEKIMKMVEAFELLPSSPVT